MSNVQECIALYLDDPVVTDAQFRAVIRDAAARDAIELAERQTYWSNVQEARDELRRTREQHGRPAS